MVLLRQSQALLLLDFQVIDNANGEGIVSAVHMLLVEMRVSNNRFVQIPEETLSITDVFFLLFSRNTCYRAESKIYGSSEVA